MTDSSVSPGHDWKFPFLITFKKVTVDGENMRYGRIVPSLFWLYFLVL